MNTTPSTRQTYVNLHLTRKKTLESTGVRCVSRPGRNRENSEGPDRYRRYPRWSRGIDITTTEPTGGFGPRMREGRGRSRYYPVRLEVRVLRSSVGHRFCVYFLGTVEGGGPDVEGWGDTFDPRQSLDGVSPLVPKEGEGGVSKPYLTE